MRKPQTSTPNTLNPGSQSLKYKPQSVFLCVVFILFSCQSTPEIQYPVLQKSEFLPLDRGASVYIVANARAALGIINLFPMEELNNRQTRQMLERTDSFAAALFPQESTRRFQLTAWGNYPNFRTGLAFSFNRGWKKQRSGGDSFWYSPANGLSIMIDSKRAFVVSSLDGIPAKPVSSSPGVEVPEEFNEFSRGCPLSCWVENPAPQVSRIFSDADIPIRFPVQQLFINFYPAGENRCEALIRMLFENSSQARGAASILNLASGYLSGDFGLTSIFFANNPVQNGRYLDIKTAQLNEDAVAQLFHFLQ